MPRKKEYIEAEVIEKAMNVFWQNGYKSTSMRMLEKEMGINQFSIQSSFGNKQEVLIHSIKCYKNKLKPLIDKMEDSKDGIEDVKQFFYDFYDFIKSTHKTKGCLINNTLDEFSKDAIPDAIRKETIPVLMRQTKIIRKKLKLNTSKDAKTVKRQINYILMSLQGLCAGSKLFKKSQVVDFIEITFENL